MVSKPEKREAGTTPAFSQFLADVANIRTSVEHKWTAWMADREDGIAGTGATELDAIKSLAEQYREDDPDDCGDDDPTEIDCPHCGGTGLDIEGQDCAYCFGEGYLE